MFKFGAASELASRMDWRDDSISRKTTLIDERLAKEIASKASPVPEEVAGGLSWGADEHLLLSCAAAVWIALTISRSPLRPASSHLLLFAAASAHSRTD